MPSTAEAAQPVFYVREGRLSRPDGFAQERDGCGGNSASLEELILSPTHLEETTPLRPGVHNV